MKIEVVVVGKTDQRYLEEGIAVYLKRLPHYISLNYTCLPNIKKAKNKSPEQIKQEEGELILKHAAKSDWLVLMDERGKEFTSQAMAKHIEQKMVSGIRVLTIVIGGAYGFSEEVYQQAKEKWALSKLTFSHQMVRLFLFEQLYRSFTILKGEPYHHA